ERRVGVGECHVGGFGDVLDGGGGVGDFPAGAAVHQAGGVGQPAVSAFDDASQRRADAYVGFALEVFGVLAGHAAAAGLGDGGDGAAPRAGGGGFGVAPAGGQVVEDLAEPVGNLAGVGAGQRGGVGVEPDDAGRVDPRRAGCGRVGTASRVASGWPGVAGRRG